MAIGIPPQDIWVIGEFTFSTEQWSAGVRRCRNLRILRDVRDDSRGDVDETPARVPVDDIRTYLHSTVSQGDQHSARGRVRRSSGGNFRPPIFILVN
ncbi:hypothetical protein [Nocardia nova]|uniref:hypothetical protein n=1 Tax=Nocardia nova TaxID=37330 RepID=UPI0011AFFD66|nr:hypothetical protein [Nocardia nova]